MRAGRVPGPAGRPAPAATGRLGGWAAGDDLPPASAAWREGDPVGRRQFYDVGALALECGVVLPDVRLAYETWGTLSPTGDNAVLVEHALTGDSHVTGPTGPGHPTEGWWDSLVGPGRPIDTDRWFVVAPNVLGGCQGTTGPASLAPDGRPVGRPLPARHRPGPGRRRDRPHRRARDRQLGAGDRCLHGWHAGAGVGRDGTGAGARHRPDRHLATATSAATRSPGSTPSSPRSSPTPTSPAATTTTPQPARGRTSASASPGRSRTPPTGAPWSWTSGSDGTPSPARTRWPATGGTRSSRTWTTTPASWPGGSTPTPTWCSPRRSCRTTSDAAAAG